jgi:hypothetical protein
MPRLKEEVSDGHQHSVEVKKISGLSRENHFIRAFPAMTKSVAGTRQSPGETRVSASTVRSESDPGVQQSVG